MGEPDPSVRRARYLSNPRLCVDCAGTPLAGHTRCGDCHTNRYLTTTIEGAPA